MSLLIITGMDHSGLPHQYVLTGPAPVIPPAHLPALTGHLTAVTVELHPLGGGMPPHPSAFPHLN
jgi:hypothetical protein